MAEIDRRNFLLNGGKLLLLGAGITVGSSLINSYIVDYRYEAMHKNREQLIQKVYNEENHQFLEQGIYFNGGNSVTKLSKNYALRAVSDGEFLRILTLYMAQQSPLTEGKNSALSPEAEADKFGQRFLMHFGMSDAEAKQFQNSVRDPKKLEQIMQESFKRVIDSRLAAGLGAATFQYPTEFGLGKKPAPYISDAVFDILPSSIKLYDAKYIEITDENKIRALLRQQNFEGEIRSNGIFNIGDIDFDPLQVHPDVANFIVAASSHTRALNSFKDNSILSSDYAISLFYFNKSYEVMLKNLELKSKNNEFTSQENSLIDVQLRQLNQVNTEIKKVLVTGQ